jgi:hypothetical protein
MGGLGFKLREPGDIGPGDIVKVSFNLDDQRRSHISRQVEVRIVRDRYVGAEFISERDMDKHLGFYLMA